MTEFTSKTGAKIVINPAPWRDAKQLKKAIERELAACGDDMGFMKVAFVLDSSDAIDAALQPCLIRCTRNDQKITDATFDDVDARGDYHEIAMECARINISPLYEGLLFQLEKLGLTKKKNEKLPASA